MNWFSTTAIWWSSGSMAPAAADMCTTFHALSTNSAFISQTHWFWHPNDKATLKTVDELVSTYEQTIGRGGQLMLGLAPDRRGLLPDLDVKRLEQFGTAIRKRYTVNLIAMEHIRSQATEAALDGDPDTFWSAPTGSHHAILEADFPKPVTFDHS